MLPNSRLQTLSSFIFLYASWAKTEGAEVKVSGVCRPVNIHFSPCMCANLLTQACRLIPNNMPLSVQVHAQKKHTQTVYFTRTHHKDRKMIFH